MVESYAYYDYARALNGTLAPGLSIRNGAFVVMVQIKQAKIPAADALELSDVEIYQALRPLMPASRMGEARPASRLIDLLDEFDGLVLDGYGSHQCW